MHRRVNRGALGPLPARAIRAVDLGQPQAPPKHGLDITIAFGGEAGVVHVTLDPGKAVKVTLDVILRRLLVNAEIGGKAERAHAVNQTKVDDLGVAALLAGYFRARCAKNFRRGGAMHVFARCKRGQ